jgi:hypothetical protein
MSWNQQSTNQVFRESFSVSAKTEKGQASQPGVQMIKLVSH